MSCAHKKINLSSLRSIGSREEGWKSFRNHFVALEIATRLPVLELRSLVDRVQMSAQRKVTEKSLTDTEKSRSGWFQFRRRPMGRIRVQASPQGSM